MANRLFLFCIGGTGARVAKSLVMLLASGCKLGKQFDTVVPILIDPDSENGDLNRTKDILKLYRSVRQRVDKPEDFFYHKVRSLKELSETDSSSSSQFLFDLEDTHTNTFREFIGFNELDEKDKDFFRLLYSKQNLNADLNVGFKGNPNMGSIVLDQFTQSEDFKNFCQIFSNGDAVFMVSSIFGGTGASGFPLLLKTMRSTSIDIDGMAKLNAAKVGALVMLPYFKVADQEESEIDSKAFEEKAKTAIRYYNNTLVKNGSLESMYMLGYKGAPSVYDNHEGQIQQKNMAHLLELIGAFGIIDFTREFDSLQKGVTKIKEFGLQKESTNVEFKHLDLKTTTVAYSNLSRYRFFTAYLNSGLGRSLNVSRWTKNSVLSMKKTKLDKDFFSDSEYKNYIESFNSYFDEWIKELDKNSPSFSPFKPITDLSRSLDFLKDKDVKPADGFRYIDQENNAMLDDLAIENEYTQLIKLFGRSTKKVFETNNLTKI